MRRTTLILLALVASTVALAAGAAGVLLDRDPAPDAGEAVLAEATTTTTAAPRTTPSSIGTRSGRLEDLARDTGPAPARLALPALGIDAPVVPIGVEAAGGAVEVPDDVQLAGWYRFGPRPGDAGSAVVTAHVDSSEQGAGAFFRLREAEPGATVDVAFDDGTTRTFEVVGRRRYGKAELPTAELFAREGEPVLTLVTCGGEFDASTGHYEDNVVVFARPFAAD